MSTQNQLSQEEIKAIENYGDRIKTLKDFVTAVRKRPGYHNGSIGNKGMLNLGKEIFQNAVDQILEGASSCKGFKFFYDERSLEVEVEDSGLGIPFDQLIRVFNTPNTSKNYEKKPFEYSTGLHGAGSKIVNALSSVFIVESYRYDGTAARVEFEKGYPKYDKYKPIPNKEKKQGLKVYFIPDLEVMGDITLEWKEYYRLIKMILAQTPIGTYCEFKAIDINGKVFTETIENKDGILTDLIMKVKHPIIKPIVIFEDNGYCRLHCAFCFDGGGETGPDDVEHVTAFSNFCETVGGTHIDGTIEGITRWFINYMNNIYLSNQKAKDKLKVTSADIKNGLNVMISAAVLEAIFDGQSKNILSNVEMQGFCKEVVMKGLDQWSKSNPQDLAKISKFFKDMAELRTKAESSKAKIVTKYQANPLSGLPAKYIKPLGKEHLELLIVEGDSACGSATIARNKQTQGLFPIRGKIINAFRASKQAVFSNEEIQGIVRIILGSEYKRNFPVEDCKVEKVIFMADGDVDKSHCRKMLFAKPCGSSL